MTPLVPEAGDNAGPGGDVGPSYEPTPEPTWNATPLAGVNLPPFRDPVHADEPTARVMETRIWDHVGPGWTLAINRNTFEVAPADPNAFQALYLISPEGERFFLYKLRTDYWLGITHWDPVERVAWIARYGDGDSWQTVELALVPGDATEKWVSEDLVPRTVSNVDYLATTDDGTEVFATMDYQWNPERLLARPTGGPTTMLRAFADAVADPTTWYVATWVDPATKVAYYRVDTTTDDWATSASTWYTHDLTTDTVTPFAVSPQEAPSRKLLEPRNLHRRAVRGRLR